MNTKDYNATLDLAVSAILDGQVLKGCSLKLANGKMIRDSRQRLPHVGDYSATKTALISLRIKSRAE